MQSPPSALGHTPLLTWPSLAHHITLLLQVPGQDARAGEARAPAPGALPHAHQPGAAGVSPPDRCCPAGGAQPGGCQPGGPGGHCTAQGHQQTLPAAAGQLREADLHRWGSFAAQGRVEVHCWLACRSYQLHCQGQEVPGLEVLLRCLLGWQGSAGLSAGPSGDCTFTGGVVGPDDGALIFCGSKL